MTASPLTADLASEFDDVPPALIASTVQAASGRPGEADVTEDVAREWTLAGPQIPSGCSEGG